MKLDEIAQHINAHLRRFMNDPKINTYDRPGGCRRFYYPSAAKAGAYVQVSYVTYQGTKNMRRAEAEVYLAWLDAGNIGTHYNMESQEKKR